MGEMRLCNIIVCWKLLEISRYVLHVTIGWPLMRRPCLSRGHQRRRQRRWRCADALALQPAWIDSNAQELWNWRLYEERDVIRNKIHNKFSNIAWSDFLFHWKFNNHSHMYINNLIMLLIKRWYHCVFYPVTANITLPVEQENGHISRFRTVRSSTKKYFKYRRILSLSLNK